MKEKLNGLKKSLKTFNQRVICFPVWIILGVAGAFRSSESSGWKSSKENDSYGKMY